MKPLLVVDLTGCKKFNSEWATREFFVRRGWLLPSYKPPRGWMAWTWNTISFLLFGLKGRGGGDKRCKK